MSFPLLGSPKIQFFDSSGSPLASGTLAVLDPADDTNKASYPTADDADAATNANVNPIVLDSRGEPPNGLFGIDNQTYKLVLKDSTSATIWTVDDVRVPAGSQNNVGKLLYPTTTAETAASVTPSNFNFEPLDPRRYGDNTTPNTTDITAFVQASIDVAEQMGGGIIRIPDEVWLGSTVTTVSGQSWIWTIKSDNIRFKLSEGATLKTTQNAKLFGILGDAKTNGVANWDSNKMIDATAYDFTSGSKADASVTLATAAEDSNFAVDDYVFIKTGNLLAATTDTTPDSEINQVTAISTGVLTLRWPLSKPYAKENYDSGSTGKTSVGGGGSAAPFGIAVVTDRLLHNISFEGGALEGTGASNLFSGGSVLGFSVKNTKLTYAQNCFSMGNYRIGRFKDNIFVGTDSSAGRWHVAAATGCTDVEVSGNNYSSEVFTYLHVHEGVAQCRVHDNITINRSALGTGLNVISVRARGYDFQLHDEIIIGSDTAAAVFADVDCIGGGTIDNIIVSNTGGTNSISIDATSGWTVGTNKVDGAIAVAAGNVETNPQSEVVTTTNVILASESRKTFYLNASGGFTSTLPAPAIGLKYTFIVKGAPLTAYIITTNGGDNILQGFFLDIVGELSAITAQDTLNFVANKALPGDRLEVESDATSWFCKAFSKVDGGITVSA